MPDSFDSELGQRVHQELLRLGIETPMLSSSRSGDKIQQIQEHIAAIMDILELDRKDDSLVSTPHRVAKMMINETFSGLNYKNFPKCTRIANSMNYRGSYVLEKKITIYSTCEHHFVPIVGYANIAYVPKNYIVGLSKLNRLADFFSRRPQVQERLTEQIRASIAYVTETQDVAVQIDAVHLCVRSRGVRHTDSTTSTFSGTGVFGEPGSFARQEFIADCR